MNLMFNKLPIFVLMSFFFTAILVSKETTNDVSKKEIVSLSYQVRSKSSDLFVTNIIAWCKKRGGYMLSLSRGSIVLRIPKQTNRKKISQKIATTAGVQIFRSSRQANEVGSRISNLRSQLKSALTNLKNLRELSTKAGLDDLLDLETALSRSLQKVEKLKGEISFLETSASLYHVTIRLNSTHVTSNAQQVPIPWIRRLNLQGLTGGRR